MLVALNRCDVLAFVVQPIGVYWWRVNSLWTSALLLDYPVMVFLTFFILRLASMMSITMVLLVVPMRTAFNNIGGSCCLMRRRMRGVYRRLTAATSVTVTLLMIVWRWHNTWGWNWIWHTHVTLVSHHSWHTLPIALNWVLSRCSLWFLLTVWADRGTPCHWSFSSSFASHFIEEGKVLVRAWNLWQSTACSIWMAPLWPASMTFRIISSARPFVFFVNLAPSFPIAV